MAGSARIALLALAFIASGAAGYGVRVSDRKDTKVRNAKKDKEVRLNKPWLRNDLSHLIYITPDQVRDYGHPSAQSSSGGGTHASPVPHKRRGHWRELKSDRFRVAKGKPIFIKELWVGATAWELEGRTYELLIGE